MTHADGAESAAAPSRDRYARGLAALRTVSDPGSRPGSGGGTESAPAPDPVAVFDRVAEIAPDLARFAVEFGYGDVWSRPGLTPRQRQIATIAALAALGNAAPQLGFHIGGALNVGVTRREIVETFIHAAVYAGFPAALNALAAARTVFADRPAPALDAPGAPDAPAQEARQAAPAGDRHARGLAALLAVDGPAGAQILSSLDDLAPDLATYIVDFVFGDIYSRPGLDLPARELASIAMCTALGTAGPQLRVHLRGFLNVGGTREEIVELMIQLAVYAGFPAALNGVTAAREVLATSDAR